MHIGYHNDKHIYQMGSGENRMDLNQVTSEKDLDITFQDDLQFYQTLVGQSQEGKLNSRSYSSQFPTHRQRDAYTSLQGSRPSTRGVCFKCVVTFKLRDIKLIGVQRRQQDCQETFGMNHTTSDSPPWAYQHFNSEEKELTCCKYSKF